MRFLVLTLSAGLDSLEQDNQVIDTYWGLLEYQIYAVQFRYEIIQADTEPLDREQAIYDASRLIKEVEQHFELELAKPSPPSGSDI